MGRISVEDERGNVCIQVDYNSEMILKWKERTVARTDK